MSFIHMYKKGRHIKHQKGGVYKILAVGQTKRFGTWLPSITYQEVSGMGEVYTRTTDDMKKFCPHSL